MSILVLMFALGTVFAVRIPGERFVATGDPMLHVEAEMPGFDAAMVEAAVTVPLAGALAGLPGVREWASRTREGRARLVLRFVSTLQRDRAVEEARRRLQDIDALLPAGMEAPVVTRLDRDRPPAVVYAVTANRLSDDVARWVRDILLDPLRELPEVGAITIDGLDQQEILIQPDARRLAGLGLGFADVVRALRGDELAPRRRRSTRNIVVIPSGAEAIAARAVRLPSGEPMALAEVARVSVVPRTNSERPRQGDAPALRLAVYARSAQQAAQVAERTHAHLAWLRANDVVPSDMVVHVLHDAARAAKEWRGQVLGRTALVIVVLLGLVFVALGPRASGLVAVGFAAWLPVSLAVLWSLGFTLDSTTAAGAVLACLPFAVMLGLPGAGVGVLTVLAVAGVSWAAGLGFDIGASGSVAFGVMLLLGVLVRWLTGWWDRSRERTAMSRVSPPRRSLRLAILLLACIAVIAVARTLSNAHAEQGTLRLRLHGDEHEQVTSVAHSMLPALHAIGHLEGVAISARAEEAWRLHLDAERVVQAGLTLSEVGRAFAVATGGLVVGEVVSAEQKLPLRVQLPAGAAGESFERLLLRGERDKRPAVYLPQVGFVERVEEPRERLRVNGRPAVEITARWEGKEARDRLEEFCREIEVPVGYRSECVVLDSPAHMTLETTDAHR